MKPGTYVVTVRDDGNTFVNNADTGKFMLTPCDSKAVALRVALEDALPYWSEGDLVGNENVLYLREGDNWNAVWFNPALPSMAKGPFTDKDIERALDMAPAPIKIFVRKLSE